MTIEDPTQDVATSHDAGLRLDKWLWQARFFKTRTLAADVASQRKIRINRMVVTKPHYKVRPGDVLTFSQGHEIRVVRILALGSRRGPATEARTLYEDIAETKVDIGSEKPEASRRNEAAFGQKKEAWGGKDGLDPRRARKQAINAKMNGARR